MNIPNKNFAFYYDGQWFVSVKLPIGSRPTVYMKCGTDNRPFAAIINDIQLAFDMLDESIPSGYTKDIRIAIQLPGLLGYRRCNAYLQ